MFEVIDSPIEEYKKSLPLAPETGARCTFEGIIRNNNEGKTVTSLEFDVYGEMAIKEGKKLVQETIEKFDIIDAICIHRTGHLQIGDVAVWIEVISGHRKESFRACEYIIDELKQRVPIWKREHYPEGKSEWLKGHVPQC